MTDLALSETGLHTRRDLLYKVAGDVRARASFPKRDLPRRIWPDEPNVGFVEERMAFFIDGALKIGGPTLKTYELNNDGTTGWIRETRLYQDDTYGKLRGSENGEPAADVFNAVGYWYSATSPAAGNPVVWETEVVTDSATYSFESGIVSLLRPGVYRIGIRGWGRPDLGILDITLASGGDSVQWSATSILGDTSYSDELVRAKTDNVPEPVTVTLDVGSVLCDAVPHQVALSIMKMR